MKCPYCQNEMIPGSIYGDRYSLKWMPKGQKLIMGIWAHDPIILSEPGVLGRPRVNADYCDKCEKMIIDVKESRAI